MKSRNANKHICLAVLPLQVMADNPDVEMFCSGLVMDLITDLSRFRNFRIISYETMKGFNPDVRADNPQLHELQLDYLIKGMVRHQNDKLHLNLQLHN